MRLTDGFREAKTDGFREANDWIPLSLTDLQLEPPGPRLPLEGPYYTPGTTLLRPRLLYTLV